MTDKKKIMQDRRRDDDDDNDDEDEKKNELWTWDGYWARSKQLIGIAIPILSIPFSYIFFFFLQTVFVRAFAIMLCDDDDAISNDKRYTMMTSTIWQKMRDALIEAEIILYLSHVIHSII